MKKDCARLFQESLPPTNSREDSQERRRKRNSRESDSRERLTERPEKPPIDLAASIADCCCIGPRSRLPLPRIPPAISSSSTATAASSASSSSCPSIVAGGCSPPLPASTTGVAETTPTLANNSRGAVQTSVGNIGSTSQQQQQPLHHYQQHYSQTAVAAVTSSSPSTSLGYSSGVPTTTQTVSVPRQLAQWTKHQTLKLQVLASVDRAPRSIICSSLSSAIVILRCSVAVASGLLFRDGHSIALVRSLRKVQVSRVDSVRCKRWAQGIQGGVA